MNILDLLQQSAQGGALRQAAESKSIPADALPGLLKQLMPALSGGLQRTLAQQGGLDGLRHALESGNHSRYLDDAAALSGESAVSDGNGILGHLLGSKDVSRAVATKAAEQTGLDVGAIKQFLPLVAAAALGAMSKQTQAGASLAGSRSASGLQGLLGGMLDSGGDGGMVDDLMSIGRKFFK